MREYDARIVGTYSLKYYCEFVNRQGVHVRMEIKEKDLTGFTAMKIGSLQALNLELQGSSTPYEPIVKTNLTFTLADAPDRNTTTKKFGGWREFLTPDSTKFLVILYTKAEGQSDYRIRWSGYITPDSYQESLGYCGSVTIVARDNIGHLQDFDIDDNYKTGYATLEQIIQHCMALVNFPMDVEMNVENSEDDISKGIYCDGVSLADVAIDCEQLDGDWEKSLENILEALGLTMRFVDDNVFCICNLRNLPLCGYDDDSATTYPTTFFSGTRSFDPACKQIIDEITYSPDTELTLPVKGNLIISQDEYDYVFQIAQFSSNMPTLGTGHYSLTEAGDQEGWDAYDGILDPRAYNREDLSEYVWLACNKYSGTFNRNYYKDFGTQVGPACKLTFTFGEMMGGITNEGNLETSVVAYLKSITYIISYTVGSNTMYWDGSSWSGSSTGVARQLTTDISNPVYEFSVSIRDCPSLGKGGQLRIQFTQLACGYVQTWEYNGELMQGAYAPLESITVTPLEENAKVWSSDKITTVNDTAYNVTINRSPDYSTIRATINNMSIYAYKSQLFYFPSGTSRVPSQWGAKVGWGSAANDQDFAVLLHKQLLMFYHTTQEVLEGDFIIDDISGIAFDGRFSYKGKTYLLLSGTYDLISGEMTDGILREFIFYDDLWDD